MLVQRGHPIIFVVVFSGLLFPFVLPCLSGPLILLNCLPHFLPVLLRCLLLFPTLVYFSLFSFFEGTKGLRVRAAINNEARRARADSSHPTYDTVSSGELGASVCTSACTVTTDKVFYYSGKPT